MYIAHSLCLYKSGNLTSSLLVMNVTQGLQFKGGSKAIIKMKKIIEYICKGPCGVRVECKNK